MDENSNNSNRKNKGGRPKKKVRRGQLLGVKCNLFERKIIEAKAKLAVLSISEYLRELGVNGKIDRQKKALPKEVLQLTATLNHIAASLNQIAKKMNSLVIPTTFDLDALELLCREIKEAVLLIKNQVQ